MLTIIVFIIFLNAAVGFAQQYRADKAIEKLKKLSETEAKVYRSGVLIRVPASEITTGDVIELKSGDIVPADCRVIEADNFSCDESSLTGENQASRKTVAAIRGKRSLGDRTNMAFSGTFAVSGRALCVVTEVGESQKECQSCMGERFSTCPALAPICPRWQKKTRAASRSAVSAMR